MSAWQQDQYQSRLLETFLKRFFFVCLLLGAVIGFGFVSSMPSLDLPSANLIKAEQAATNHSTITTTDNVTRATLPHAGSPTQIYAYDSPTKPIPTSPTPLIIAGFLLAATTKPRRKTPPTTPPLHLRHQSTTAIATTTDHHYDNLRSPHNVTPPIPPKETGRYYYG